jgi:hypothetical protein
MYVFLARGHKGSASIGHVRDETIDGHFHYPIKAEALAYRILSRNSGSKQVVQAVSYKMQLITLYGYTATLWSKIREHLRTASGAMESLTQV